MSPTRRQFLAGSGAFMGAAALGLNGQALAQALREQGHPPTLVTIYLRGGADPLSTIIPAADPEYHRIRPTIGVPARSDNDQNPGVIPITDHFGLHPAMGPLHGLYEQDKMAGIVCTGSTHPTRSHFDAQDFMESGTPGIKSTRDGWMNRYLRAVYRHDPSHFRAVALSGQLPRSLSGPAPALAIPELTKFGFPGGRQSRRVQSVLEALYAGSDDALLEPTAEDTFEAVEALERLDLERLKPEHGATYPRGGFGGSLRQIAQLIKAGVGLELAFTELGGWDTHVNQGRERGPLANLLRPFSAAVGAFCRDLGPRMEDVVLVTLSEFGRTAFENGNGGTDHGHANAMFLVGGGIQGGFHGDWPGLGKPQLYEGRDLALTSDFRTVLGEVLTRHLGAPDLASVFPGFDLSPDQHRGLFGKTGT